MKNILHVIVIILIVSLTSKNLARAEAECGKVVSVTGDTCSSVVVKIDTSKCGGGADEKMNIKECKGDLVSGFVQTPTHLISVSGKGTLWGGKVFWKSDEFKISATASAAKTDSAPIVEVKTEPKSEVKKSDPKKSDLNTVTKVKKKKAEKTANTTYFKPNAMPMPPARKGKHPASELEPEPEPSPALKANPVAAPVPEVPAVPVVPAPTVQSPTSPVPVPVPAVAAEKSDKKDEPTYSLFGDIRHREEKIINENPDPGKNEKYEQFRLRARLGVKAQPTSDTVVEFRLATGSGGVSTNQTYGETVKGLRNYDFKLDRAFAKYTPSAYVNFSVGRMANQFTAVGDNDLLFDSDLNFDGYLVSLENKGTQGKSNLRGGQYILEEVKDSQSTHDVTLGIAQVGVTYTPGNGVSFGLVATNHKYGNVKDHAALVTGDFGGNSSASSKYLYNFNVTSYGLEISYDWKFPVVLFYEGATNEDAPDENKAYIYGLKLGKLKNAGDWALTADTREIKKDATLGILSDGDAFGGGTNGRTNRISIGYNITKFLGITVTNFKGKKNILPTETAVDREKWQLDFNIKF